MRAVRRGAQVDATFGLQGAQTAVDGALALLEASCQGRLGGSNGTVGTEFDAVNPRGSSRSDAGALQQVHQTAISSGRVRRLVRGVRCDEGTVSNNGIPSGHRNGGADGRQ